MKKIILFTIAIMLLLVSDAQTSIYKPFPEKMVKSAVSRTMFESGEEIVERFHTEIIGDTILNGIKYSKIYETNITPHFWGGIRNDIPNKKIYQYKVSTNQEKLLYDFNLAIGDTLFKNSGYGFYDFLGNNPMSSNQFGLDTVWVSSIDSVFMKHTKSYHKRFNFSTWYKVHDTSFIRKLINSEVHACLPSSFDCRFNIFMCSLVEGVGQINGPVREFGSITGWVSGLNCATLNGIEIIAPIPGECKSVFSGIAERENGVSFTLFPNPSDGKFQLIFKEEIADELKVMNLLGKIVYTEPSVKSKALEFDLSDLATGIYFVKLNYKNGRTVTTKIIKN